MASTVTAHRLVSAIKHETPNFWVLDVGRRGYEVYRSYPTHSVRVACIGLGDSERLGLPGAIAESDRRQAQLDGAQA